MNQREDPENPHETVLHAVSRLTGEKPKVLLRDSDSEHVSSPYVSPKSGDSQLFPKGRGNYQILGEVARGGMGVILKAHDTDLGRDVAVKVLDEKLVGNPAMLHRFIEEAQIGGQLQHPGIVPVYEMGLMADERPYFTMKFVKGRTLAALLAKRKSVSDERRRYLSIFEQVCQTVAYAHSKGVIHRDLKPANIMVGAFGEVQVVDWGLAKVLKSGGVADELMAKQSQFTVIETVRSGPGSGGSDSVVGSVMGTPAYMAPEQAMGEVEKVDERADVFALGAILCEIVTGEPPYVAREGERTVMLAAHAKLDPARERIEECEADAELKSLCLECLAPAPAARLQNAEEVAQRIHDYLASLEERAHRAELAATEAREQRRRQRLTMILATTIVLAVVAVGAVLRSVEKQRETDRIQQLAATRRQLDDASGQVAGLQDQGRYDEALEVARAALFVFESGDQEDPTLEGRANSMVAVAEERVAEAAERKAVVVRNEELLARCDELRLKQIETLFNFGTRFPARDLEAAYDEAFQEYGIDVDGEDLVGALETLVDSGIGAEVALALDDWASLRRELFGVESHEVEAVTVLAFDLDPDPARTQLREALLANDRSALLAFAGEEDRSDLPPSTIWVLSQGLASFKLEKETFQVVRDGAIRYPDDFLLNIRLGDLYGDRGADDAAIRFLSAARGVRPDNAAVNALLGDRLQNIGDLPGAVAMFTEAVRLNPGYTNVYPIMGGSQIILGDLEGARRSYESILAAAPLDDEAQFGEFIARCAAGEFSSADLMESWRTNKSVMEGRPWITAWLLSFHADPGWRDPAGALEIIDSWRDVANKSRGLIEAAALIQLDRPQEALVALERGEEFGDVVAGLRALFAAIRARAYFVLEDRERAEHYFDVCETIMEEIMYDGPEPWSKSALARWHRENAERLGR